MDEEYHCIEMARASVSPFVTYASSSAGVTIQKHQRRKNRSHAMNKLKNVFAKEMKKRRVEPEIPAQMLSCLHKWQADPFGGMHATLTPPARRGAAPSAICICAARAGSNGRTRCSGDSWRSPRDPFVCGGDCLRNFVLSSK